MSATEYVILVDQNNTPTGVAEKFLAHKKNLLHRAFSIFLLRETTHGLEVLLQQRAADKYHCPNLWTNTCCSHPRANESVVAAGKRRLQEELNLTAELTDVGWFHYNAHFDNGLSENEIDHVLIGYIANDAIIQPNPNEVQAIQWLPLTQLPHVVAAQPTHYTPWLLLAFNIVKKYLTLSK